MTYQIYSVADLIKDLQKVPDQNAPVFTPEMEWMCVVSGIRFKKDVVSRDYAGPAVLLVTKDFVGPTVKPYADEVVYTVGHRESYLEARLENPNVNKIGRYTKKNGETYEGGIIFKTRKDAQAYLDSNEFFKEKNFSIFAVAASWDKDTYAAKEGRHLKHDAPLLFSKEDIEEIEQMKKNRGD